MSTALSELTEHDLHETFWGKKIIAAEARGHFTESDLSMAGNWVTCACGKQSPAIPRVTNRHSFDLAAPLDGVLYDMGFTFAGEVADNAFFFAALTLIEIEKRAIELLRELAK